MKEEKQSITIRGAGSVGGGTYGRIHVYGSGTVQGNTEAEAVVVWGAGEFEGDLRAGEMAVRGAAEIAGALRVDRLKCAGALEVSGAFEGGEITVFGALECGDSLQAEAIRIRGAIEVDGLLSGDRVEIHLGGKCQVGEIGGERIEVYPRSVGRDRTIMESIVRLFGTHRTDRRLIAEVIEGDEVRLERTTARVVRGRRVSIGSGCRIDRVEYRDGLDVHPDAVVGELQRLDAAHGKPINQGQES